jgi:hypothetical protein
MSDNTVGRVSFYSSEDIDIAVALTCDGFRSKLSDADRMRFDRYGFRNDCTVFQRLLTGVGFSQAFVTPSLQYGIYQYEAEYEDTQSSALYLLMEHLANLGMGLEGMFQDGDGGEFILSAEINSGVVSQDTVARISTGVLETLTRKSSTLDELESSLKAEDSPDTLIARARALLSEPVQEVSS